MQTYTCVQNLNWTANDLEEEYKKLEWQIKINNLKQAQAKLQKNPEAQTDTELEETFKELEWHQKIKVFLNQKAQKQEKEKSPNDPQEQATKELEAKFKELQWQDKIMGLKQKMKMQERLENDAHYANLTTKINAFDSMNNLDSDMNSRMGIGNYKSVDSADCADSAAAAPAQSIDYVTSLPLSLIREHLKSRKYLHGRYLEENGSISISTHAIFKFKDKILESDKYLLMNDYISKEEKQIITQNEFQSEMVKSSYLSVNVRVNVFAFCFGVSGGYGGAWSSGTMDNQSSNQAKIFESTQFIRARVTITPQCLEYTGMYIFK